MSDNYIGNVLSILRLLKNTQGLSEGHAAISFIHQWSGDASEPTSLRVSAYVQDQIIGAESLIGNSTLADEAKQGLLQTTNSLRTAFSLGGMGQTINHHLPALDASLSSFAILASATGAGVSNPRPKELDEILVDIEDIKTTLGAADVDPLIRDVALKHLSILKALLDNVQAFGVDSAIAAYWEFIIRIKRAEKGSTADTKEKMKAVWPKIEQWVGRLTIIEQAMNSGSSILSDFSSAAQTLLPHIIT